MGDCGENCVEVLHELRESAGANAQNASDSGWNFLGRRALDQVREARRAAHGVSTSLDLHRKAYSKMESLGKSFTTDTACGTEASCQLQSMIGNKCNYGRQAMQMTYQSLNLVAHVMGVLVTLLCGCLYVHTMAVCVLQSVPPICVFPYNVYGKIWTQSIQVWESLKSVTKMCMIHGDAMVAS